MSRSIYAYLTCPGGRHEIAVRRSRLRAAVLADAAKVANRSCRKCFVEKHVLLLRLRAQKRKQTDAVRARVKTAGLNLATYYARIARGWDPTRAIRTPLKCSPWTRWKSVALAHGVTFTAWLLRVRRGMLPDKAATSPMRKAIQAGALVGHWTVVAVRGLRVHVRCGKCKRILVRTRRGLSRKSSSCGCLIGRTRRISVRALAIKRGVSPDLVYLRIQAGQTLRAALAVPGRPRKGRTGPTYKDLARKYSLSIGCVAKRLRRRIPLWWSTEKARSWSQLRSA